MSSTNQSIDPNHIRENHLDSVIVGVLLGDAHAEKGGANPRLKFEQGGSESHETYLFHLYSIFKDFVNPLTPPHRKVRTTSTGKEQSSHAFSTYRHPYFLTFTDLFYEGRVKVIRPELENYLNPVSLAYWYLDDGGRKSTHHKGVYLHTHSFSLEEVNLLCNMLALKFSLSCHPVPEKSGKSGKVYYKIYISGHSYGQLRALIFSYLIPARHYKFPTERRP